MVEVTDRIFTSQFKVKQVASAYQFEPNFGYKNNRNISDCLGNADWCEPNRSIAFADSPTQRESRLNVTTGWVPQYATNLVRLTVHMNRAI